MALSLVEALCHSPLDTDDALLQVLSTPLPSRLVMKLRLLRGAVGDAVRRGGSRDAPGPLALARLSKPFDQLDRQPFVRATTMSLKLLRPTVSARLTSSRHDRRRVAQQCDVARDGARALIVLINGPS